MADVTELLRRLRAEAGGYIEGHSDEADELLDEIDVALGFKKHTPDRKWRLKTFAADYLDGVKATCSIHDGDDTIAYAFEESRGRLIAAAPAMLRLLKRTLELCGDKMLLRAEEGSLAAQMRSLIVELEGGS